MKQDINFPKVEGVHVAIARLAETPEEEWAVFLLNYNDFDLHNILITSKGYGKKDKEDVKTSTLRQLIPHLAAQSFTQVERIQAEVFALCNEFWVSYYINKEIYDKKFIFLPESVIDKNLQKIELLNLEGVLHS